MFNIEDFEKPLNVIDEKHQEDERIFVYMGSYAMVNGVATLTYDIDKSFVYKKYRDLESGNTLTVNKDSLKAFEKGKKIINVVVQEYTPEAYEETFKVVKKTYEDEMKNYGNKEEAYKLMKRLTPLK